MQTTLELLGKVSDSDKKTNTGKSSDSRKRLENLRAYPFGAGFL